MARSDPTAWTVEVLEGPAAGARIPLEGRELPFRPGAGGSVGFGGEQRSKLVWYPGNPVATQLVFGPTLKPTTINGVWQDRYLGEDRAIDLVDLFTELMETGVQVRVVWGSLEYQGIVKGVDFQPGVPTGGLGDIAWSITFEWNSRGGLAPRRVIGPADKTIRDGIASGANLFGSLRQLADDLVGASQDLHGLPNAIAASFATQIEDLRDEGAGALGSLSSAAAELGQTLEPSRSVLEDADTALEQAIGVSAEYATVVSTVPPGILAVSDDVDVLLLQALDRVTVVDAAFASLEALWEEAKRIADLIRPEAFVFLQPVRGADLRDYALLYYGDADLWRRIAEANGIEEGSRVPDDVDELLVPLSLSTAFDDRREDSA